MMGSPWNGRSRREALAEARCFVQSKFCLMIVVAPLLLGCGQGPNGVLSGEAPAIGERAPETVGEDLDGRPLQLSDFRGKVVLLSFWGHW